MLIFERVATWQSGMVQNRHQSGGTSDRRTTTAPRHQNLHFSREIRPSPPNDGAKGEKSAYLSGNSTPSANCLGGRRGGWNCEILFDVRAFWPSANGLAWRKAPLNHRCIVRADKCYLIATMPALSPTVICRPFARWMTTALPARCGCRRNKPSRCRLAPASRRSSLSPGRDDRA